MPKQSDLEKARLARVYYQKELSAFLPKSSSAPEVDFSNFPVEQITESVVPIMKTDKSGTQIPVTKVVSDGGWFGGDVTEPVTKWELTPEAKGTIANYLQKSGKVPSNASVDALANMIKSSFPETSWAGQVESAKQKELKPQLLKDLFQPATSQPGLDESALSRIQEKKKQAWDQAKIMVGEKMNMTADKKPGDPVYDKWLSDSTKLYKYMIQGFENDSLQKYQPKTSQPETQAPRELTYDPATGDFI